MFVKLADPDRYSYLLGIYLGDGHVGRNNQLRVWQDASYPGIVEEVGAAMQAVHPEGRVILRRHTEHRLVVVECCWKRWREFFPQAGPGRKHERPIVLVPWQQEIVDDHPQPFLRGLIHSDGCRVENRFKTKLPSGRVAEYAYPRYFFSNLSTDIRSLFCATCDRLGVRWTQSNHRNISVSHRHSVAILDEFIGPKA